MKPIRIDVRTTSKAKPSTVYAVAKDSSRYPAWSPIGSFEHVRPGAEDLYGVGSLRIFRTGRASVRTLCQSGGSPDHVKSSDMKPKVTALSRGGVESNWKRTGRLQDDEPVSAGCVGEPATVRRSLIPLGIDRAR